MYLEKRGPQTEFVAPDDLQMEGNWDAAIFVGNPLRRHAETVRSRPLGAYAQIFEGRRDFEGVRGELIYRSGAVAMFDLTPSAEQWTAPASAEKAAIRSGDLLLKRVGPLVAAVVPPGFPSWPADANFIVIRGLAMESAWWIGYALNHPAFGDYLLSKSGRGVLSRVSLSVLRDWSIQEPPSGFLRVARALAALSEKRALIAGQIAALKTEVEAAVGKLISSTAYEETEDHFAGGLWFFRFPAPLADRSWLPQHVATDYCATLLHRDADWQSLPSYLIPDEPSRERFTRLPESVQILRLSDVQDVSVMPSSGSEVRRTMMPNRIFRQPIQREEVLLSTLGSNSRVAYAPASPHRPLVPVDHWARLRFRVFPAAYALILQTGAVARQMRNLATGTIQQFVKPEDIRRLFLPVLPDETLAKWDRAFRALARSWQEVDADRQAVIHEGWQIILRTFNLPAHSFS